MQLTLKLLLAGVLMACTVALHLPTSDVPAAVNPLHLDSICKIIARFVGDTVGDTIDSVGSSKRLAQMAMVCSAWWVAAREAASYRVKTLGGHPRGCCSAVCAVAALPRGGGLLAIGTQDRTRYGTCWKLGQHSIRVLEVGTGKVLQELKGHNGRIRAVIGLEFGLLASGSEDMTARVWNVSTGQLVRTLEGHTKTVSAVVGLHGGLLASGSHDRTVRVYGSSGPAGCCTRCTGTRSLSRRLRS